MDLVSYMVVVILFAELYGSRHQCYFLIASLCLFVFPLSLIVF
uniref:Uncharacterized protein n=1 Tax=Rhizophora mucronata TaxID=61149 RepID=A0A2P2R0L5_RHIMU